MRRYKSGGKRKFIELPGKDMILEARPFRDGYKSIGIRHSSELGSDSYEFAFVLELATFEVGIYFVRYGLADDEEDLLEYLSKLPEVNLEDEEEEL